LPGRSASCKNKLQKKLVFVLAEVFDARQAFRGVAWEVLDVMIELAEEGMTMLCVTHEMGFAKTVANRVIFMDKGEILEENVPDLFFSHPQSERGREFLGKIL